MHLRIVLRRGLQWRRIIERSAQRRLHTQEGIIKSPYGTGEFPDVPLHECIYTNLSRWENKTAVECGLSGKSYTYGELRKAARILAATMQNRLKLDKGDVIAIFLPNIPEYPVILLASSEAGVVATTVNSSYKHEEVSRQLENSKAKVVFTMAFQHSLVDRAVKSLNKNIPIVIIKDEPGSAIPDGAAHFEDLLDPTSCGELRTVHSSRGDVALLPYSSGTTGLSKGVELTHGNIVANLLQLDNARPRLFTESRPGSVALGLLPMFHIYGITVVTFSTLYQGHKIVSLPKFDPNTFVGIIASRKISMLYLVPPLVIFLSNQADVTAESLKNVEYVMSGAAPCGEKDMEKLLKKGKNIVMSQGYGMTETSPVVLLHNRACSHKFASTGVPIMSTEMRVVDVETSAPQPAGKPGELWVRGPQVMKGYLNNQKATDEILDKDGWLKTGDVGYYDEDGDFFISDRLKDLIKVKGFQVPPAELEEILRSHPKIVDAAVIGVPHPIKGEVPKAFVSLRKNEEATEEEIKNFVKERVARHKELDGGVVFLPSIPKSAAGKLLKNQLK